MRRLAPLLVLACTGPRLPDDVPGDEGPGGDTAPSPTDPADDPCPVPAWCPAVAPADAGVGRHLRIGPDAVYCATFDERRTLAEEGPAKAVLHLPSGVVDLPESGEGSFALQGCVEEDPGEPGLIPAGDGTVVVREVGPYWIARGAVPLVDPEGAAWRLQVDVRWPVEDPSVEVDGAHLGLAEASDGGVLDLLLCPEPCTPSEPVRRLDSCRFEALPIERHMVRFEGGAVEVDLRIGTSLLATQPALMTGARGTLDGTAWHQDDYWRLWYNPIHHHVTRDALAWLPEPIGPVHGIAVLELDNPPSVPTVVHLVDADGQFIATPVVLDDDLVVLAPE